MPLRGAYALIAELSQRHTGCAAAFTGLIAAEPHAVTPTQWHRLQRMHAALRRWQEHAIDLIGASLAGTAPPEVAAAFIVHLPEPIGWRHHRQLPWQHLRPPLFFRTDQADDGTVLEVQCPGSLWGVHEILRDYYLASGHAAAACIPSLADDFTAQLVSALGAPPVVHHLMDNASHPAGERYLIQRLRPKVAYFGYDVGIRPQDCNLVRAHDFPSLLVENFATERLGRLGDGCNVYDLPPAAIFDQKLLIALPFWNLTRGHFDDEVRQLFPHTTVLTPDGLCLEGGERISLEQFSALPRSLRDSYLKYAGTDVSRNWGSRAVWHLGKLSHEACLSFLNKALAGFDAGERWIVQHAHGGRRDALYLTRDDGLASLVGAHTKHSTFFGPNGPLGVLTMAESFHKVHGSAETVTSVGALVGATQAKARA